MDLIRCGGADADIGFRHQRVPRFRKEGIGIFPGFDNLTARNLDPCPGKCLPHQGLALDPADLVGPYPGHVEIGAQAGFGLKPEFVVRVDPVQFSVAVREVAKCTDQLVIIVHAIDAKIFGEGGLQLGAQRIITLICQSEDIDAVVVERQREPVIVGRKVRGQKNEVHRRLPSEKLTKYTKFWWSYGFQLKQDLCAFEKRRGLFSFTFGRWIALWA